MAPSQTQIITKSNTQYLNTQSQFNSTFEATIQSVSLSISSTIVIWLVGVAAATSRRVVELIRMWMTRGRSMKNLNHFKNIKMNLKVWTWKIQMIGNVPELQKENRSEVVVGEVGTVTCQILVVVLFAIHVLMQWISFKNIAKCLIGNEITQLT
jgi:hypothetical protein